MLPEELQQAAVAAAVEAAAPGAIVEVSRNTGELTLVIAPEMIRDVCRFLKHEQQFARLSGITAVDWYPMEPRFEVVYELHSLEKNERVRLKCRLESDRAQVDSVTSVWRAADWYEREVFDLFGIHFRGHPRLRRILLPVDWEGHPLRKDYPVHGYKYSYKDEQ